MKLARDQAAGTSTAIDYRNEDTRSPKTFYAYGAFDGASVVLEASPDGINFAPVANTTLTAPGAVPLVGLNAEKVQITVTGGTAPAINSDLV